MKYTGMELPFIAINGRRVRFTNELETIAGIGPQTAQQLLTAFRSVKKIKEQTEDELALIVGKSKAKLLLKYFTKERS